MAREKKKHTHCTECGDPLKKGKTGNWPGYQVKANVGKCRDCTNAERREQYAQSLKRGNPRKTNGSRVPGGDIRKVMCSAAKQRVKDKKDKKIPFNLVPEDIHIPNFCPVLGIPLFQGVGTKCDNSPTLDRIDPRKGYTRGNVRVISYRANELLNNSTAREAALVARDRVNGEGIGSIDAYLKREIDKKAA